MKCASLLLVMIPLSVSAEEWSFSGTSGGVYRWCEIGGRKVVFSSRVVPGFQLCGELKAEKQCDPSGRRFIAPSSGRKTPYAYRDCSLGKRIHVERLPEEGEQRPAEVVEPDPMTVDEALEAKRKFDEHQSSEANALHFAVDANKVFQELGKALQGPLQGK